MGRHTDRDPGHVFKQNVDEFLGSLQTSEVRTVEDNIEYNKQHAEQELPSGEH